MQGEEKGPHSGCPRRSRSLFLLAEQAASAAACVLFSFQKADQKVKESSQGRSQEWPGASQAARGMRKMPQHSGGSALAVTFSLRSPESSFHSLHPYLRALLWVRDVLPTPKSLDLVKGSSAQRQGNGANALSVPDSAGCPQQPQAPRTSRTSLRFSWAPWASVLQAATEQPIRRRRVLASCNDLKRAGETSEPSSLAFAGAHPGGIWATTQTPRRGFQTTEARAHGSQAFASLTASVFLDVPSTLTSPHVRLLLF